MKKAQGMPQYVGKLLSPSTIKILFTLLAAAPILMVIVATVFPEQFPLLSQFLQIYGGVITECYGCNAR